MESLAQLETLCERLYTSQNSAERAHAESTLKCFSLNPDYIPQCQYILDNASTPYALVLASSSLLKQITEHKLSLQMRLDIRNYVINYLATRGPELENFVIGSLIQLLCRVTKFGWFDDDKFREVVKEATNFLNQASSGHYSIGLKMLNQLVSEMNQRALLPPQLTLSAVTSVIDTADQGILCRQWTGPTAWPLSVASFRRCWQFLLPSREGTVASFVAYAELLCHGVVVAAVLRYCCLQPAAQSSSTTSSVIAIVVRSFLRRRCCRPQLPPSSLPSPSPLSTIVSGVLKELTLSLALKCLSFDFIGSSVDESSEEFGTLQIPSSWKPVVQDPSTLQIFFDYYRIMGPPLSKEALECLVRLASVRRSLFTDDPARFQFLGHLMNGTKEIIQTGEGLADHDNYHEFCRLLGRFKVNYQLSELLSVESYGEWIHLVAEFTTKSLQSWQWASSSVYYLLGLWSRLVTSVPYLKGETPSLLDETVPKITEGFITSRFNSNQADFPDDLSEDPLDNAELLQDHLEFFPYLCRYQYETSSLCIMKIMDPILQVYTERASSPMPVDANELAVIEGQISWIVHIIAAILKVRQITSCRTESQELIDAELAARVLQLSNVTDIGVHSQRYGEISKQRLDRAILTFFQNFRKSYVGDHAMHSSKQLYLRLSELLGLHDHLVLLNFIVGKIAMNLKHYPQCEDVIEHTLSLFLELASGYMTGKLLLKLDSIKFIIVNHTVTPYSYFASVFVLYFGLVQRREKKGRTQSCLLDDPGPACTTLRCRVCVVVINEILALLSCSPDNVMIGLIWNCSDAAFTFDAIAMSFYCSSLHGLRCVTTPLLKFMAEFVLNKAQRLSFDSSSPNGILLFRELTKAYFAFMEVLFSNHISFILNLDTNTFLNIIGSLEAGLKGLDTGISSQCASAVDNLATFYFNHVTIGEVSASPASMNFTRHIAECPNLFTEMFANLRIQMLASQPMDQQQRLSLCFEKLMADVTRSLDSKNRDKFTQNLTIFRREFRV
ncbi:hypothetical protein MUK42_06737 [Musa troglodytarum]|uniref:Importin N-terminal domain-containing protein n=1 Tax=Musa troglodytarum TaxID=320322 RepID=A0A9E7HY14_9LILI|nr:hypothetical protein MUK42_06737 [Musa troglodytarum]